jgi:hypothetical protein
MAQMDDGIPYLSPANAGSFRGTYQPRLTPGSIFWSRLRQTCPRSGLQEIATGFSRWNGSIIHRARVAGDSHGTVAQRHRPGFSANFTTILFSPTRTFTRIGGRSASAEAAIDCASSSVRYGQNS